MIFCRIVKEKHIFFAVGIVLAGILIFEVAHAQVANTASLIDVLQKQITELQQKVTALQNQLPKRTEELPMTGERANEFRTYLERGMSGEGVRTLQRFLARFPALYPGGLVTGYFGILTESAVKRFQTQYGIEQAGVVGAKTRAQLNILLASLQTPASPPHDTTLIVPEHSAVSLPREDSSLSSFLLLPKPQYDIAKLAQDIHTLINEERAKQGRMPLSWDWPLGQVAFLHSADQARDNDELTDPDKICNYPLIRHEGFTFGTTLKDRLQNKNISFRIAAENIGILPLGKNLIYQYPQDAPPMPCRLVDPFEAGKGTPEERIALYQNALAESLEAARIAEKVVWVNRDWYTEAEIAKRIVDGWMNSPGHRENILEPTITHDGIGIAEVNHYVIITHDFAGR